MKLDFTVPPTLPEAAVEYAKHGWPVIPLMPCGSINSKGEPSKEPIGELVPHGSKDATTAVETVRSWWRQKPNANIGVVGMSAQEPFAVIDVDMHGTDNGFESLKKAGEELPQTLTARTPSGGVHKFCKWTQGERPRQTQSNIRDRNGAKILGVDVRGVNGYVAVYPSKTVRGQYEWLDGDTGMAEFPEWAKRVGVTPPKPEKQPHVNAPQPPRTADDVRRRASAYLAKVDPAVERRAGHGALLHAAEVLVVGFELDDQTALDLLWNEYNPRCQPPWDRGNAAEVREFERKIGEAHKVSTNVSGYLLGDAPRAAPSNVAKVATGAQPAPTTDFTNYTETVEKIGGRDRTYYHARTLPQVAADLLARTNNWPRQIGSTLFAFEPDKSDSNQRYRTFTKPPSLFTWIREAFTPRWKSGNGGARDSEGVNYVTAEELYQHLLANAKHYEGISRAPHWPKRRDQFYDYGELPPPSDGHRVFWQLIDFFCLADATYRLLAAAFFLAPMYYATSDTGTPGQLPQPLPRPQWLIDTVDAQGSGKSTLVKMVALLYGSAVLDVNMSQLARNSDEVLKRILSVEGRQKRLFLIDNVTGTIKDSTLANWVTAATLSGRAAYGHGDETRANDFTWCITVNGAEIDTDTATRAYTIKVRKRDGEYHSATGLKWEADVTRNITENRRQLYADILDMLDHAKPRNSDSRFPDFDATVLSAVCDTDEQFAACRARIEADATGANVDAELAAEFTEAVESHLAALQAEYAEYNPALPTMLTNAVIKKILDGATGKLHEQSVKQIRVMLKSGLAPNFSKKNPRLNKNDGKGGKYPEGIVYGLHLIPDGATETAFQIVDIVPYNGGGLRPDISHSTGNVKVATLLS